MIEWSVKDANVTIGKKSEQKMIFGHNTTGNVTKYFWTKESALKWQKAQVRSNFLGLYNKIYKNP